ncbi:hypothetical protein JT55_18860 [Rhodovulum sp. NI22]|nr:hypothetical protein JT55_18860 [Rhodovulum sp. NI22]
MLIGSNLVAGTEPDEEVLNPRTGELIATLNTHFMLTNEMPHGGMKQSGYGKDMSTYALEDYSAVRHVMIAH